MRFMLLALLMILPGLPAVGVHAQPPAPVHALAMHGQPKYGPAFQHFDYANPEAPKGGEVRLHFIGTFDTRAASGQHDKACNRQGSSHCSHATYLTLLHLPAVPESIHREITSTRKSPRPRG